MRKIFQKNKISDPLISISLVNCLFILVSFIQLKKFNWNVSDLRSLLLCSLDSDLLLLPIEPFDVWFKVMTTWILERIAFFKDIGDDHRIAYTVIINKTFLGNLFQPLLPNNNEKWDKLEEVEGPTLCYL